MYLIDIINTDNEKNIIDKNMKDRFFELNILSEELWNEVKGLRYRATNKKKAINKIEKIVLKIKELDLDEEIKLTKTLYNIK